MQRPGRWNAVFGKTLWLRKQRVGKLCAASAVRGVIAGDGGLFKQTTGDVFMQKKLLALAVASALAPAAAFAQQSTVEIYGRANLGLDTYEAKGSDVAGGANNFKSRYRIYDQGSRLGFRVNESLGGGMRAFVVLETGVNFDRGDNLGQTSSAANTSSGFWASRASYAGIGGDWGDVRFGRQDVWWSNGVIAQTGANYINTAADGVTTGGFQSVTAPATRTANVVSYNTPTWGGFNASVYFAPNSSTDQNTGSEGTAYTGTGQKKASLYDITARYTGGPFRAQFDWAAHKYLSTDPAPQREDSGMKLGVGWAYAPGSQISAVFEKLTNKDAASLFGVGVEERKVDMWLINWEHMLGQWQLLAQYLQTGDVKGLNADPGQTKAKAYTIGAKYFLSKRTGVYASYNKIDNQANAWADYTGGAYSSANLGIANRGADPTVMAVGMMHNF
jgi:predicted porin